MDLNSPTVSVCMISYNHEKYIAQAIEGVLMQKTTFTVELVIGEDCSTDNTRAICEEYASKYPDKIKLLPAGPNLGMNKNFIRTLQSCIGKYIAYCEGDDFWTDPEKLQMQVDILEQNPQYSCVYHDDDILKEREANYEVYRPKVQNATTANIIANHFIPSLSMVFRNIFTDDHFPLIIKAGCLDLATSFVVSLYGNFYYINKKMATYRLHEGGVTASYKGFYNRTLSNIKYYRAFNIYTNGRYLNDLSKKSFSELEVIKYHWGNNNNSFSTKWYQKMWLARFILFHFPGNILLRCIWSFGSLFKK